MSRCRAVYRITEPQLHRLNRQQEVSVRLCVTCRKPIQPGDRVASTLGANHRKKLRHYECAKKMGIWVPVPRPA